MSHLIDVYVDFGKKFDRGSKQSLEEKYNQRRIVLEAFDKLVVGGLPKTGDLVTDEDVKSVSQESGLPQEECRMALARFFYWRNGGLRNNPVPNDSERENDTN